MAKYKSLERDIDEEFKDLLLDMNEKEFTEYFKRLFKDYYEVLFTYDTDYNRYTENSYKKYEVIRKGKKLLSFKYNNLDNFENLERLKISEEIAYNQMNELYFMEKAYNNLVYHDRLMALAYINETLANLIEIYKETSSDTVISIIEDVFKRSIDLIKEVKKLPVPEEVPSITDDIDIIEANLFSKWLKEQLEKFDSIVKQLKKILPEEIIDEYEDKLYMSDRLEFINRIMELKDNEEDKEEAYKIIASLDYIHKKEDVKYLYQKLNNWYN